MRSRALALTRAGVTSHVMVVDEDSETRQRADVALPSLA